MIEFKEIVSLAKEFFKEGFYSAETYNDVLVNNPDDAWEEYYKKFYEKQLEKLMEKHNVK